MTSFDSKAFLKNLTTRPGVYRMLSEEGDILYVGKAKNLKNRVGSYFRKTSLDAKTLALVARVADVNVTVTDAVALTEPDVAVIIAVPAPTDVTDPDADTVATPVFDDVHVTGASLIVAPFWSLTMTASCCVDPAVVKFKLVGDIVIDEAMRSMIVRVYVWLPVSPPLATVMVNW